MERIAFLGLGIMGSRMAANLARAGHELRVWTHTPGKADAWAGEHGATPCATPAAAAKDVGLVISMVVDGDQVRTVLLDEDDGAAAGAAPGTLFIDQSTIAPRDAVAIAEALAAHDLGFVDAPVTGSSPKAESGTLTIMAGGGDEDVARARPVLEVLGSTVLHAGPVGHGQKIKLINNAVSAANAATLAQALVVGAALDVDLETLEQVMATGSGGSAMLDLKAGPMRRHDWTTLFKTAHMLKDVRLCLEEAQAAGVPFPAAQAARDALAAAVGRGHADDDFAALLEAYEGFAGKRVDRR